MNIFVIDPDPAECAKALDDKRLNKMTVETAQLLSTALHVWDHSAKTEVYKPTHRNHPCALWVADSLGNYLWAWELLQDYIREYMYRSKKLHKTSEIMSGLYIPIDEEIEPIGEITTPFPNCSYYKQHTEVCEAYRRTLRDKWAEDSRPPKWTSRGEPEWK